MHTPFAFLEQKSFVPLKSISLYILLSEDAYTFCISWTKIVCSIKSISLYILLIIVCINVLDLKKKKLVIWEEKDMWCSWFFSIKLLLIKKKRKRYVEGCHPRSIEWNSQFGTGHFYLRSKMSTRQQRHVLLIIIFKK